RNGMWTPVQVPLQAGSDDVPRHAYRLIVESSDGEGVPYRYGVAIPAIPANSQRSVFAYVRPGRADINFTVLLQTADGANVQEAWKARTPAADENADAPGAAAPASAFVTIEKVADMPDRWFGYEAVDVLVLTTADDAFVADLLKMDAARRDALLEWVRRGGRLVLSVGRNQRSAARWLENVPLVDGVIKGKLTRAALPNLQLWCGADARKQPLRQVEIAGVEPGANMLGLVHEEPTSGDSHSRPVLLQSSCGLGRVVLVAFDVAGPPFSTWHGQGAFWKKLREEIAPRAAGRAADGSIGPFVPGGELGVELKRDLETFEDVPVISFGWVALFILVYIVLVGPFDYFILKKIFKRLELTWITFPVTVLLVSAAAYATAYCVKGDDLRINKIDLIDIDLHDAGQVYGQSWFTLFSPRVRNYTIGVEPASPRWGGRWHDGDADAPRSPVMVAALDGAGPALGGHSRSSFRQPYEYTEDAAGLRRVPIPVWATRSFVSSWRVP
ncbi:MAG: hypothetical protein ACRELF_18325, partial [Gemmataceae bacterium]